MPKPITVTIDRGGFIRRETFDTQDQADHWAMMMNATLDMPQRKALNLHVYAQGLASSVRAYGGARTYEAWLRQDAAPEDWARGQPVSVEGELRKKIRRMLRGPGKR